MNSMLSSFRKKLILLLFLLVLFVAFVASRFYSLLNRDVYGRVKVTSSPPAGVFIGNVAVGQTPYESKQKEGEYEIKLIPEGTSSAAIATWQGKVKVYKNSLTYINRDLGTSEINSAGEVLTITRMDKPPENQNYGEVYVETEPSGAIVYLDNDDKATSPFVIENVLKGDHELSVFMPGFLRRTQKVDVHPGYRINAVFKLALDPNKQKQLGEPVAVASPSGDLTGTPAASPSASVTPKPSNVLGASSIVIGDTPTGFLRVRSEPSVAGEEIAQVKPGETYPLLDEQDGWYKIKVNGQEGWISADYSSKK
jgi:hypothetical protein